MILERNLYLVANERFSLIFLRWCVHTLIDYCSNPQSNLIIELSNFKLIEKSLNMSLFLHYFEEQLV